MNVPDWTTGAYRGRSAEVDALPLQAVTSFTGDKGTGFTPGIGTNDILRVRVVCATVS